jgi:hypothetical protein
MMILTQFVLISFLIDSLLLSNTERRRSNMVVVSVERETGRTLMTELCPRERQPPVCGKYVDEETE